MTIKAKVANKLIKQGGYTEALYILGCCYEKGEGVVQKYEAAIELYTIAVKQGLTSAKDRLLELIHKLIGSSRTRICASKK